MVSERQSISLSRAHTTFRAICRLYEHRVCCIECACFRVDRIYYYTAPHHILFGFGSVCITVYDYDYYYCSNTAWLCVFFPSIYEWMDRFVNKTWAQIQAYNTPLFIQQTQSSHQYLTESLKTISRTHKYARQCINIALSVYWSSVWYLAAPKCTLIRFVPHLMYSESFNSTLCVVIAIKLFILRTFRLCYRLSGNDRWNGSESVKKETMHREKLDASS